VTVNNLLPGSHDTDRIRSMTEATAKREGIAFEEAAKKRDAANPTGRIGTAEEFGQTCAFMCSVHAGFMVGQNILLDGGAFNSTV
jgi:3-oxoacyl-[acyl-carrier protein] reductase